MQERGKGSVYLLLVLSFKNKKHCERIKICALRKENSTIRKMYDMTNPSSQCDNFFLKNLFKNFLV